jgi:hypothetical protein
MTVQDLQRIVTNTTTRTEGDLNGQLLTASQARAAVRATRLARHWIDGQWRDSADHRDSINPASGEKIGSYALGKEDEAADAVAAAVRAFRDTDWKTNRELRAGCSTKWRIASKRALRS